jgi:hypothetical protein
MEDAPKDSPLKDSARNGGLKDSPSEVRILDELREIAAAEAATDDRLRRILGRRDRRLPVGRTR